MTQLATTNNVHELRLSGGKIARVLVTPQYTEASQLVAQLDLAPIEALVVVVGSTSELEASVVQRLSQLFGRGLARGVRETQAGVIDGGTDTGIIAVLGQAIAAHSPDSPLIGVAPHSKIRWPDDSDATRHAIEPHHSHMVLVEADNWGDETDTMFKLANSIGQSVPVVTVVAGGGTVTKAEVLRSVRKDWPVIVIEGSGRLADEIAAEYRPYASARQAGTTLPVVNDPELSEIVSDGNLYFVSINSNTTEQLERLVTLLCGPARNLQDAWDKQKEYSYNAGRYQGQALWLQRIIFTLAVAIALVTAIKLFWPDTNNFKLFDQPVLFLVLLALPLLQGALILAATQFDPTNKWLRLRGATEAVKSQTYRYRTRTGLYSNRQLFQDNLSREARLRDTLSTINSPDVKAITLRPLKAVSSQDTTASTLPDPVTLKAGSRDEDNGKGYVSADSYIQLRLKEQRGWYRRKATILERRLVILQVVGIVASILGTALVAVKWEIWIVVTSAVLTAVTAYLEYRQTANTLRQYNQAAGTLEDIEKWWKVLTPTERSRQSNFDKLVDLTEGTLQAENQSWLQQMQLAASQLNEQQKKVGQAYQEGVAPVASSPASSGVSVSLPKDEAGKP